MIQNFLRPFAFHVEPRKPRRLIFSAMNFNEPVAITAVCEIDPTCLIALPHLVSTFAGRQRLPSKYASERVVVEDVVEFLLSKHNRDIAQSSPKSTVWHLHYGRWWMVQWHFAGWISLGVHVDFCRRHDADGLSYGPYVDIHMGCFIFSLGNNPVRSGELRKSTSVSRGGL